MLALLVVSVLLQTPEIPQKYLDAAAGIELPADLDSWKEKSPLHRKAVEVIGDRTTWARGLQLIDEKLGLSVAAPKIKVIAVETDEPQPAKGAGRGGTGEIQFNMRKVVEYLRKLEEIERIRAERKEAAWVVPPTPLSALVHHELVHCFTGPFEEPWLGEGLAAYVADETAHLWDFQYRKAVVVTLDRPMSERDAYALGYCAIAWLREKYGADRMKAFVRQVVEDKAAVRKAVGQATGKAWDAALAEEGDWAREFLAKNYTPKE